MFLGSPGNKFGITYMIVRKSKTLPRLLVKVQEGFLARAGE